MLAYLRAPWWKSVLVGSALSLLFLAIGAWAFIVVSAAVAGFLSSRGRSGAVRGIQATAPVWILWLLVLSTFAPVEGLFILLGGIFGPGWGLVIFLFDLVPILLGLFGGMAGGYLAELLSREGPAPEAEAKSDLAAR